MKRYFALLAALLLLCSLAFAANQTGDQGSGNQTGGQGSGDQGAGSEGSGDQGSGDQGTGTDQQNQGTDSEIREQVRENIQDMEQEMNQIREQLQQEAQEAGGKQGEVLQKQNEVKIAAQTLSKVASMTGGIGPQVSEIAQHFENSVQATIQSEEKIQTRSSIARFFAGGDHGAADNLEKEVTQNQQKIQELKQLKDQCQCDEQVKQLIQEQIQQMEQEQTRLKELADKEKKSKGMFGWLWK